MMFLFTVFGTSALFEYNTLVQDTKLSSNYFRLSIISFLPFYFYYIFWLNCNFYIFTMITIFHIILLIILEGFVATFKILLGILWISPSMFININYGYENPYKVIIIMTIIWISDGFQYLGGKTIGKRKLIPSISPGKTIEGTITGIIVAIIASYIFSLYYFDVSKSNMLTLGCICSIIGIIGDIIESIFKRYLGIKDSGSILPGHSGILDRFDSVFLAIPASYIYLNWK